MKKTLFLAAALLMAPAMVRAEEGACGNCDVTKIVTANWKQFVAGVAVGAGTSVYPTDLASNAQSLLVAIDNSTALNVVGTQLVHTAVDGKKGIANVTALVAFTLGRWAGAQLAALRPAGK